MPGPRTITDLRAAGTTEWQLRQRWRPVLRGVRVWHEEALTRLLVVRATALTLPPGSAIGGRTAAWLQGADVAEHDGPVEVVLRRDAAYAPRAGIRVRRALLAETDRAEVAEVPVTTPVRTAFDLARLEPVVEAVTCVDALVHIGAVTPAQVEAYAAGCRGWRGVRRCAEALGHVDGAAESPMESRLRMLLVQAGLPRPVVNQPLYDAYGCFLARPDLRIEHVLVEYDGSVHRDRDQFNRDLRRQNRLVDAGFTVLRYTGADVYGRAASITAQVRRALAAGPPRLRRS